MFKFYLISLLSCCLWSSGATTEDAYILKSESLPSDLNFMPSLSNGHLGYTVFGDAIFMNGIYNGAAGNSRRARIPNWLNISAELCNNRSGCLAGNGDYYSRSSYEMNLYDGYFRSIRNYTAVNISLEQRTYPHRYYSRALVYELIATRHGPISNDVDATQFIRLDQHPGGDTDAFDFVQIPRDDQYRQLRGRTKAIESNQFQQQVHEINVLFSAPSLEEPYQLYWAGQERELRFRVVITIDRQSSVALKELEDVLQLNDASLLETHRNAWHEFWNREFSIKISGNAALELSRIVNAGIYYLVSSLPAARSNQANEPYYGLSPTGLARGNLDADYEGHNFWDTEIWTLPVITQFGFQYAELLVDYRYSHLEAAKYNANATGYKGARFPWESAFTGTEVTNPCCPQIAQQEIHISPDISFALQKLFAQSNDETWLCAKAWPIASEVANFLVSRSVCNEGQGICHFLNIMGPDEDHANVDDNVYTNAVAKIALEFAAWTAATCGGNDNESIREWRKLKDALVILYDKELDYHPQHLGYQLPDMVKQADTILLGYPLQFDVSSTHLNDLNYYANVTRESGPAMTWSMFAANYLATTQDWQRANDYFRRGYQSYVRPQFKVWSETPIGYQGSANFLTGIGGFLQALIFGYGGLNFARIDNNAQMQMRVGQVPSNVDRVLIRNIQFAKSKCQMEFANNYSFMDCRGPENQHFVRMQGEQRTELKGNFNVTLNKDELPVYINVLNAA